MGILWCLVKSNRRCKHGIKEHNSLGRDVTWKFSCCMYVDKLEFIYLLISVESILCSWDSKQVCRGPLWLRLDLQLICTFPLAKEVTRWTQGNKFVFACPPSSNSVLIRRGKDRSKRLWNLENLSISTTDNIRRNISGTLITIIVCKCFRRTERRWRSGEIGLKYQTV